MSSQSLNRLRTGPPVRPGRQLVLPIRGKSAKIRAASGFTWGIPKWSAIVGSSEEDQQGGDYANIDDSSIARVDPDGRDGLGAAVRAQRSGRDHGTLAPQFEVH